MVQSATPDLATAALARLVATLCEDAIFAFAAEGARDARDLLDGLGKRREPAYAAVVQGNAATRMATFDAWLGEMVRAIAPVAPPQWLPMADVLREKVTLEIGARGLRSLFSSKPSDKDVQRVKRLGTLAVRVMRAVFAADGAIDGEEQRTIGAFVGALGLSPEDAGPLLAEPVTDMASAEVYGEMEPAVTRAVLRGAWLAATWDGIDPREEQVVRTVAKKLALSDEEVEAARAAAIKRSDERRAMGLAVIDAIRFVLPDRVPGPGVALASSAGSLVLPRRMREEALAPIGQGAPITLAKRHAGLAGDARHTVLAIAWAAALHDDPSLARRALLRTRFDRVADDLGEDGTDARRVVEEWLGDVLAGFAKEMR